MKYADKLLAVTRFVEENFDDPAELVLVLGLSVEDFIRLLPDVLVANYNHFFTEHDNTEEDTIEEDKADSGVGEDWED